MTTGSYGDLDHPQNNNSSLGKLIEINTKSGNYKILAKGMGNSQGLYFDKKNNVIVISEHRPKGGDEINILVLKNSKM